jgi:molecular chaperone GrpE
VSWFEEGEPVADGAGSPETEPGRAPAPGPGDPPGAGEASAHGEPASSGDLDPLAEALRQRDEYLDALQRTRADFENYRKRIERTREEQSARAAAGLVTKLLPVLDALDLAQAHHGGGDMSDEAKALNAARALLLDALNKEGLERLDEAAVPFDPSVHDAVARAEPEATDGTNSGDNGQGGHDMIHEVLRAGYRWRGQVLRPAMVSVRG